jgi:hypothetical protein
MRARRQGGLLRVAAPQLQWVHLGQDTYFNRHFMAAANQTTDMEEQGKWDALGNW